jgi:hypothetical protein
MSESDFRIYLKNNADAVYANLNRKKEFFITVHNVTGNYIPQVRVKLAGPPQVKLVIASEWYSGMPAGKSSNRLFTVLPKEEGIFNIKATLLSKKGHTIEFPFEVRVGVQAPTTLKVLKEKVKPKTEKKAEKVNCPFCHEKIDVDANFCPHCGSDLAEKQKEMKEEASVKHCPNCGRELPIDAKFCAKCGVKQ